MGKKIKAYKVVSSCYTDVNQVNDYSNYPKIMVDSGNRGIHFSSNPIDVFTWVHLFSKDNTTKEDVKYLVLEVDSDNVFTDKTNETQAAKECRVIREMNIDDILEYFTTDDFKKEFCPLVALKYIKENSQKFWLQLRDNIEKSGNRTANYRKNIKNNQDIKC